MRYLRCTMKTDVLSPSKLLTFLRVLLIIPLLASFFPLHIHVKADSGSPPYKLLVDRTGFYRVTYEDLLAAGVDLSGVPSANIALINQGQAVPIYLVSGATFGPGSYFDFYGQAIDSLYTHTNVYYLANNSAMATRMPTDNTKPPRNAEAALYYMETAELNVNKAYSYSAPISDPWYDTRMLAYTSPQSWTFTIETNQALPAMAASSLFVSMYGGTDWSASPDHHVLLSFNGVQVADETFDGLANHPVTLNNISLHEGVNSLMITLPGDMGVSWDVVHFDSMKLTYPRAFVAINGALHFSSSANLYTVTQLPSNDIVVYKLSSGSPTRLTNINISGTAGNYSVTFAGFGTQVEFYVYSTSALLKPQIAPGRPTSDITSGFANYLIIAHPEFINSLATLVQLRQNQGYAVRVVDVFDVYEQFGYGVIHPNAIRNYIAYAAQNMGTQYILLVGNDTYDYFNYLGSGAGSFIPTYYIQLDSIVRYAPADPKYADLTGDNVPDLAIGRLPVSTPAELENIIAKIVAFENKNYAGTAIFAADRYYGNYTDTFVNTLPPNWEVTKAYLDQMPVSEARAVLLEKMNSGVALASYFGHSTTTEWTATGLFSANDVPNLLNNGRPFVVMQFGCWNSYFVEPSRNTLVHAFLLAENRGAAAVMGSTTLGYNHSLREFGQLLTPRLTTDGKTIGQAFLEAKQELAKTRLGYIEIYLGFNLFGDPAMELNSGTYHTPITLAWFHSQETASGVLFEWTTATEVANVGFNLYVQTSSGWERVNPQLIPSQVIDSIEPQNYTYEIASIPGDIIYLEDVAANNQTRLHGPFHLGESYGEQPIIDPIDWDAIRSEHERKANLRTATSTKSDEPTQAPAGHLPESAFKVFLPLAINNTTAALEYPEVQLLVNQDGIYRLTYEALLDAGFDLSGANPSELALINRGQPVPIHVTSSLYFGPGAYIEFYGESIHSLYTRTNIYTLMVDASKAQRIPDDDRRFPYGSQAAPYYMEKQVIEKNLAYSFGSPNGDPWYEKNLLAYTTPKTWGFTIPIDNYLPNYAPATVEISLWGVTNFGLAPDHHVIAKVNGSVVADVFFDGKAVSLVSGNLPSGVLVEGDNLIEITLPGDTGADWDMVNVENYAVTYPRAFMARNGVLVFTSSAQKFTADGLTSPEVRVYRLDNGIPVRMTSVEVDTSPNGYKASFAGLAEEHTYLVVSQNALLTPGLQPTPEEHDITSGTASYLIISHPDFINDLAPLVQARQAQGYTVRVVNVDDVYAQFGYSIFDPQAIKGYIAFAAQNMGTQYVLLVGGDTYDYLDYLGNGSMSFIPTLYTATNEIVQFAPADPLYVDVDQDQVPDLALGRFPVRTSAELSLLIQKTLEYENKDYGQTAVFSADSFDGSTSFKQTSINIAQHLPQSWTLTEAYIDDLGVENARNVLINAINNGIALTSFVGHSSPTRWTYQGLFNVDNAYALTNSQRPTVAVQWACWNTYYVSPTYNSLGHVFLLGGDRGAAAVMGASTLTMNETEEMLGEKLMPKLTQPGMTIGMAILLGKQELANEAFAIDVLLGWTLLGDPALVIQP